MKYINNKISLLVICFCLINLFAKGQDSLKIYDVFARVHYINATFNKFNRDSVNKPKPSDNVNLSVVFKINHPENTAKIFIQIGSQKNSSDFKSDSLSVLYQSGACSLFLGSQKVGDFFSKGASYSADIPTINISSVRWLTMYAIDNNGIYTKKQYFKIQ